MSRVAAEWSARSGGERGFSMGRFDPAYVAEQRVFLAWQEDSLLAFVTFHTAPTEWTLDLMRSIDNLANGVMHALIAYASDEAAASGISRFSLAAMPLSDPPRIAALLGRRPEAQGLRRFN